MRPPEDPGKQRGRPASPPGSSLGEYLRGLRLARGWTIRELAKAIGLSETSAAYISQMEAGLKVPHHLLAQKLAEQLGDQTLHLEQTPGADEQRTLGSTTDARWIPAAAAQSLPEFAGASFRHLREVAQRPFHKLEGGYRVPILPEGTDPGAGSATFLLAEATPAVEFVRLGSEVLREKKLLLPFAYRMTETSIRRVGTVLKPGDVVVISQEQVPIVEHEIYAIRHAGTVELAHALWNGRQLLLLPDAGKNNFAVLEAEGEEALVKLMVGHMVTVIRAGSSQTGS
jgi:transcriptional regulator with XRE-family HTH domain